MGRKLLNKCNPEEVALKTFFLGPQAENGSWLMTTMMSCLEDWFHWRRSLYPQDGAVISSKDKSTIEFIRKKEKLTEFTKHIMKRFENEIPKFSPRYIGHMFSEISMPALLGHFITLLHNPNNVSAEASRVGVELEQEAISFLIKMVGFNTKRATGHFTSGGTIANFEAVSRAQAKLKYKKAVLLVPNNMHYSWQKAAVLLGVGKENLWPIDLDSNGRMSLVDLKLKINAAHKKGLSILMVVSVAGSTEFGSIDPIDQVVELLNKYKKKGIEIWHHVDAAYGGFLCSLLKGTRVLNKHSLKALRAISKADSIAIDPHKLGYVPYASGAILVAEKKNYYLHNIDAPYLHFKNKKERGPQTIEGSRSAAGAVATWLTLKSMGLDGYAMILEKTIKNRDHLALLLQKNIKNIKLVPHPDSNIICFCVAQNKEKLSATNTRALKIYKAFSPQNNGSFIVSKTELRWGFYSKFLDKFSKTWGAKKDKDHLVLIRLTLMNPFFASVESKVNYANEFIKELQSILR